MTDTDRTTAGHPRPAGTESRRTGPTAQPGDGHNPRHDSQFNATTVGWGLLVGVATAAAPLAIWWLDASTVHALAITLIASVYIGVRRGRRPPPRHRRRMWRGGVVRDPRRGRDHGQPVAARRRVRRPRVQGPVATPVALRRRHPMVAPVLRGRRLDSRRDHRHCHQRRHRLSLTARRGSSTYWGVRRNDERRSRTPMPKRGPWRSGTGRGLDGTPRRCAVAPLRWSPVESGLRRTGTACAVSRVAEARLFILDGESHGLASLDGPVLLASPSPVPARAVGCETYVVRVPCLRRKQTMREQPMPNVTTDPPIEATPAIGAAPTSIPSARSDAASGTTSGRPPLRTVRRRRSQGPRQPSSPP
jgi:hypothetical protein